MTNPWKKRHRAISSPGEAVHFHRQLHRAPPDWQRDWIMEAADPRTFLHEQYRKMEWDPEAEIREHRSAFCPGSGYYKEDASRDLRQIWRSLMGRYAFGAAISVEGRIWELEKKIPWRLWRWKDLAIWRLGIAVLVGFVLLASSSGTMAMIERLDGLGMAWCFVAVELGVVFFLALAEVQRRVGRRPWWRVLLRRAFGVTVGGALWAAPGAALQYWLKRTTPPLGVLALCAATAVLMGFVFQLFWQDRSIAEPL
jgi:hypothetical protein